MPDSLPWPPYSPNFSPIHASYWSQAMAQVIRCKPSTISDFKTVVEDFAVNMSEEEVRKMVPNTKRKPELCRDYFGGQFEHLLKKHKCLRIRY